MEASEVNVEPVTMSEVLELATWDRPRTDEELQNFISRREAALSVK
ncbi:MAG: hypothetical protein WAV04_01095 [Candidatus Microsaccharimonas sp.]